MKDAWLWAWVNPRGTHSPYVIGCCLIPLGTCGLKNNSRRITYGIGCVWGMPSLSPLSSLVSTYCCNFKLLEENSSRNCRNEKRPTFPTIDQSPWLNWDVRTTIIYFRRVKLQSLLLLNTGLAAFLSLPLVGNSHSIQFINRRRRISMCNRIDGLFIGYIIAFLWLEWTKYSSKNMSS